MNIIILCLFFIVLLIISHPIENFDGIGKSFGQFYFPQKCCKSKSCYPGMYLGNDFWIMNDIRSSNFNKSI